MTTYIFDLDDTLYREHDYVLSGLRAVAEHCARCRDRRRTGAALYATMRTEFLEHGRRNVFQACIERHGLHITPREMLLVYQDHTPRGIKLYDDATLLLERLGGGYGIVSDSPEHIGRAKLNALGIDCAVVWGANKAASDAGFRAMASWLGADHRDCVYVGDNPRSDFVMPRALGWRTVRIVREYGDNMKARAPSASYEPHRIINDLSEL